MAEMCGKVGWLYQAQRVTTNTNAAGGQILIDITVPAGTTAKLIALNAYMVTTGTHTFYAYLEDEDFTGTNHNVLLANTGAAAASKAFALPSIGTASNASGSIANSLGLLIGPGSSITIDAAAASGVANDHVDIFVILLMSTPTAPTWSKARSANAADVTIAASTISTANTLQAVMC